MTGLSPIARFIWLLFAVPFLLGLAGCDNNPNAKPWQAKRPDGSPWVVSYRAFPEDPRTLDPQVAYDELSHAIIYLVYDTSSPTIRSRPITCSSLRWPPNCR
ncbi:MAG: hypothetical protein QM796_11890 [Chthoniobacteraceae bacterium]